MQSLEAHPPAPQEFGPFADLAAHFPRFAQALNLHARGELEEARAIYKELSDRPRLTAACLHQLASLALERSEAGIAVELFQHALRLNPTLPATYDRLANALERTGQGQAALNVLLEQGRMLQLAKNYADAEISYRNILSQDPLNYGAYVNLGTCLAQVQRLPEAVQQLFRAIQLFARIDPSLRQFAHGMASRLEVILDVPLTTPLPAGRPSGRIAMMGDALTTLGKVMGELGLHEEAVLCHQKSVAMTSGFALAHWNLALALLTLGRYDQGWREYEWRWAWPGFPGVWRNRGLPKWQGEPLAGKRILVWAEQGFGDTLQFTPLLSQLLEQGAQVTFEVDPSLHMLLAHNLPGVSVIAAATELPDLGILDFAVALLSLPLNLNLQAQDLPVANAYLKAEPDLVLQWAQRLGRDNLPRVGIVWAGRGRPDTRRSVPFSALATLLERRTVDWYSLQVDAPPGHGAQNDTKLHDLAPYLADFAETAAAIANLDLVITIDSAVAHLAGAMGKKTWLLLLPWPDWRWAITMQGGDGQMNSRWYPSVRLFQRHEHSSWENLVLRVGTALDDWLAA